MELQAFAKINWSLDIIGVREDGYHLMDMLMQPVSLSDRIYLSPAPEITLETGGSVRIRPDEKNLAFRAAAALKQFTGCPGGVAIHLDKQIPVGAGMGGGSADAAAVLIGLNRLWKTGLSGEDLETLGLSLGADIPFCIRGGLTRTMGIGEKLLSLRYKSSYWLVLIQPCRGLSTAEIFASWTKTPAELRPDTDSAQRALKHGDFDLLCSSVRNVLQPVSARCRPEISEAIRALSDAGASGAWMTGSGSAVFGLFRSRLSAERAASIVNKTWKSVWLCHTQADSVRIIEE